MLFPYLPNRNSARLLAISENLLIYKIWEDGFVTDGAHHHSFGAAIYGDPQCAAIAADETWCAVAGAGIEILLALPGQTLAADEAGKGFSIHGPRVEALWALGPRQLGILTAPHAGDPERRLLYVDVDSRQIQDIDN